MHRRKMLLLSINIIVLLVLPSFQLLAQTEGNYRYDSQGRLIADFSEGIIDIRWNHQNKITHINRADTCHAPDVEFAYNAQGDRVMKLIKPRNGKGLLPKNNWQYTYYVVDMLGNILAVYNRKYETEVQDSITEKYCIEQQYVYGSNAIGYTRATIELVNQKLAITTDPEQVISGKGSRGHKLYGLQNHIGNIVASVSDRTGMLPSSNTPTAHVQSAVDYYPYGMELSGRTHQGDINRNGYNGMQKDNEIAGSGNLYTTKFRFYDVRLGRWLSVDPKSDKYASMSPYIAMANNPILYTDPLGDDIDDLGTDIMNFIRRTTNRFKKTTIAARIFLDAHAKLFTVDSHGESIPKPPPVTSTPKVAEDAQKAMEKEKELAGAKRRARVAESAAGGPEPKLKLSAADDVAKLATKETSEHAVTTLSKKAGKVLFNVVPFVSIATELATAPKDRSMIVSALRIGIGEVPAAGDVLLAVGDIVVEDIGPPKPPVKWTTIKIPQRLPIGYTPEQLETVQRMLGNETEKPLSDIEQRFTPAPSIDPALKKAIDEQIEH